jgi:hypothetical protein
MKSLSVVVTLESLRQKTLVFGPMVSNRQNKRPRLSTGAKKPDILCRFRIQMEENTQYNGV